MQWDERDIAAHGNETYISDSGTVKGSDLNLVAIGVRSTTGYRIEGKRDAARQRREK